MPTESPRIPRDRVLAPGGLFWFVFTVAAFVYGAAYIAWQWWHS